MPVSSSVSIGLALVVRVVRCRAKLWYRLSSMTYGSSPVIISIESVDIVPTENTL
jgi:hypothetical protein